MENRGTLLLRPEGFPIWGGGRQKADRRLLIGELIS